MQILKGTGIDWRERRMVSNLCMDQSVKVQLQPGERRIVKTGRQVREGCRILPVLFNFYCRYLVKDVIEGFETSTYADK